MKVWITETYGDDAKFKVMSSTRISPKENELEVEVKATSLNPVDNKLLRNATAWNPALPGVLHCDVSGVVTAIGEGDTEFSVGDKVYGCAGGIGKLKGALSEYMIVDKNLMAPMPKNLSFIEAAAMPLVTITAWEALKTRIQMKDGASVLIHGGAGGVGHIAIQLAKAFGGNVSTTVSSEEKAKVASDMGADNVIYYRDENVESYVSRLTNGDGFDAVFDTIGGGSLDNSLTAAKTGGQVAGIIGSNTHDLSPMHMKSLSLHIIMMLLPMYTGINRQSHGNILREATKLIEANKLKPHLDNNRFTFDQANEAHAYYESGKAIGKISLERR
ncbi:MAG: zinc-dependent alcohol dehydrogenase family protein [Emcibacteraceae bacterium]|nr:zinc-dependent alcohol dehydrogenase family protein [Emcibacteraceae bacterium]